MPVSAADVDRLFLQAVLSRGLLSGSLAQTLWEKSIDAVNGIENLIQAGSGLSTIMSQQCPTTLSKSQFPKTKTHGMPLWQK
jgi:hypothetical protein